MGDFLFFILLLVVARAWARPTASQSAALINSPSFLTAPASDQLEQLARFALETTIDTLSTESARQRESACTLANLRIRRNWRAFSPGEKKAYINSVLCLQKLPPRTPPSLAPGAKSRYDDFVATHINQTFVIHRTGTFLGWHRYYIFEFEQALRNDCGYTGEYPYWDWGADVDAMEKSPVFDGSDTSLSGNGVPIPNQLDINITLNNYTPIILPPGTGGGCVTSGPFVNYTVNMGPSYLALPGGNTVGVADPLDYNPRCLSRDLTSVVLRQYANYTTVMQLILNNHDIWDFETVLQGAPGSGSLGVHGGGHYAMGGDPGRDADASPGDPGFFHHHGMIDRVWWIWQSLDLQRRQYALSGTDTFLDQPPSPNTTLDTVINAGYASGNRRHMRDIMSTIDGPLCYVYL